jgi:hypothetical protein
MDLKAIQGNVITAIGVAVVMGIIGTVMGVFNAGTAALDEAQIEVVIKRVLVRENGDTYGASLVSIDGTLIAINTNIITIKDDIKDLQSAVRALATE